MGKKDKPTANVVEKSDTTDESSGSSTTIEEAKQEESTAPPIEERAVVALESIAASMKRLADRFAPEQPQFIAVLGVAPKAADPTPTEGQ